MENKLFNHFSKTNLLIGFNSIQIEKFQFACRKAVLENPNLSFSDLCKACKIYRNIIALNTEVDLGNIILPD